MFDDLKVWMKGEIKPMKEATVPMLSHGFSRGSAMFEVFGIHKGPDGPYAFRMDTHLDRLYRSAELLCQRLAYTREELIEGVEQAVKANNMEQGIIKMMVYMGEQALINLVLDVDLDVCICAVPEDNPPAAIAPEPIDVCISKWRKLHPETMPTEAKACSFYLNGMLARKDAMDRGFDLGILLNLDGTVAEGSIESVFMVKDGVLKTPPQGKILRSVSRRSILEACKVCGIEAVETVISPEELKEADEIFTAHTGIKVTPAKRIEDRELPSCPGPVTQKISDMMHKILTLQDDRFKDWFTKVG